MEVSVRMSYQFKRHTLEYKTVKFWPLGVKSQQSVPLNSKVMKKPSLDERKCEYMISRSNVETHNLNGCSLEKQTFE